MNVRRPFEESLDVIVNGVEINRLNSTFVAACRDGFRIYDLTFSRRLSFREFDGSIQFATILGDSNIVGLLGSKRGPPKDFGKGEVILWNNARNSLFAGVTDSGTKPLRVLISYKFLVPICESGLAIFEFPENGSFNASSLIKPYGTFSNPHGLAVLGDKFFIFPGIAKGKLQVLNLQTMKSDIINAHSSELRALALSKDESLIATVSERGTLVRVWSTSTLARVMESRRGMDEAEVFGLGFSHDGRFLALTSDKGTLHVFGVPTRQGGETTLQDINNTSGLERGTRRDSISMSHKRQISEGSIATRSIPSPGSRPRAQSTKISPSLLPPPVSTGYGGKQVKISPPAGHMTESTILSNSPKSAIGPSSPGMGDDHHNWGHVNVPRINTHHSSHPTKAARFQDLPASSTGTPKLSTSPSSNVTGFYGPSNTQGYYQSSAASAAGYSQSQRSPSGNNPNAMLTSPTTPSSKYGALANLPFAPRLLRDTYSLCKTSFHLPSRPTPERMPKQPKKKGMLPSVPVGQAVPRGPMVSGSLISEAPVKGQVAFIWDSRVTGETDEGEGIGGKGRWEDGGRGTEDIGGRYQIVVMSAGRGGRWEKWELTPEGLKFVGWKWYGEDEGRW